MSLMVKSVSRRVSRLLVSILDANKVNLSYARYQAVCGARSVPPPGSEPTTQQFVGLAHVIGTLAAPHVDFAVCEPRGHRIQKKLKLMALQLRSHGLWTMSYDLWCAAVIMSDVVDLGPPQLYKKLITGYHRRCGSSVWHIVCQTDTRMRLEQVDRLLRVAVANQERAKQEGQVTDFEPNRPWPCFSSTEEQQRPAR